MSKEFVKDDTLISQNSSNKQNIQDIDSQKEKLNEKKKAQEEISKLDKKISEMNDDIKTDQSNLDAINKNIDDNETEIYKLQNPSIENFGEIKKEKKNKRNSNDNKIEKIQDKNKDLQKEKTEIEGTIKEKKAKRQKMIDRLDSLNNPESFKGKEGFNGGDVYNIFNKADIIFLFFFCIVYIILYYIVGIFTQSDKKLLITTRLFDIIFLFLTVLMIILYFYNNNNQEDREEIFEIFIEYTKNYIDDTYSIFYTILSIIFLYFFVYFIGIPMTYEEKPYSITIIEWIYWILLLIIIIVDFFKLIGLNILDFFTDILSYLWNLLPSFGKVDKNFHNDIYFFNGNVTVSGNVSGNGNCKANSVSCPSITKTIYVTKDKYSKTDDKEVFNIINNLYTYDDAANVCKVYGATLATYDQVEEAYNDGGDWCNYGWSQNQMALFPTQKSTWDKLQKDPKKKNSCGRPGVNGGYINNPKIKLGVNCYGKRPVATGIDLNYMNSGKIFPKTEHEYALEQKMHFWNENKEKMMNVASFNKNSWSYM